MFDLKAFRKLNKLTQNDAARLFDCAQSFISQIEKGKRPVPDDFISKIEADKKYKTDNLFSVINEAEEPYIPATLPIIKCTNPDCLIRFAQLTKELELQRINTQILLDEIKRLKSGEGASNPGKRDSGNVEEPENDRRAS